MRKVITFIVEAATAGLAFSFVLLLLFRPETFSRPTVEFLEAASPERVNAASLPGLISYAPAVEKAAPAVVNIYSRKVVAQRQLPFNDPFFQRFFGDRLPEPQQQVQNSLGSGVIISKQGHILTNNHVVEGADEIEVALHDGRTAAAKVVGTDPESDLAVLKIEAQQLPEIVIGQSDSLRVGDVVLAIGNPFGVGQTVTSGIVSATGRTHLGLSTFENFIQTDAAINPGNSGGALINTAGQLIGINSAIFSQSGGSQGIGFAIPMSIAKDVMKQIIEFGHALRGWLGVEAQDLTPALAESFGLKETAGAIIAGVQANGPAEKAGLRPGDIVVEVANTKIADSRALINAIASNPPRSKLTIKFLREGKIQNVDVTVGERPTPMTRQ
ncbi:MAG: Do family serine endopeptidase [Gammaproteobacteria bacterium]|nr:Do family serine endopeptidase [Gammaproteobacteria bacterium]